MTHGGDIWTYEEEYGSLPLDFSANVSPLGMPDGVRRAVIRSLDACAAYPDPACRGLRRALAERLGLSAEEILCGCGASDLLYRLAAALKPARALIPAPAFSEYESALRMTGCAVRRFPLQAEEGFRLTREFLTWITPGTDLVFLGQPDNPAGRTVEMPLLIEILTRCRKCGALLVTDECFLEFLDDPESCTLLPELQRGGLLILRSFTKLYGMAGLRLGYGLSADRTLLEKMSAAGPPWSVSGAAQAAGMAALGEEDYVSRLRALILRQRPLLAEGLRACGLDVIPGEANYLLFHTADSGFGEAMKERGILLRDCGNYCGLGPGWYRTAVRTEEENRLLLEAAGEAAGEAAAGSVEPHKEKGR